MISDEGAEQAGVQPFQLSYLRASDENLLTRFYHELYVSEFPDPSERESLANMIDYLRIGGEDGNGYYISLLFDDRRIVGGCVADRFVRSKCASIEFLVVDAAYRRHHLGLRLALDMERRTQDDATARGDVLEYMMAEINDPQQSGSVPDNFDPLARLHFWGRLHYHWLAFPYVQPALSADQKPVTTLLLAAKPLVGNRGEVPSEQVARFLQDYLQYAMRIAQPESQIEYQKMRDWLARSPTVALNRLVRAIV